MSQKRDTSRPIGNTTRGKTTSNRLRRTDLFLTHYDPHLIKMAIPPNQIAYFVDHGYGREPLTTLESAKQLRKLNPDLPILGVEIDPERIASALPYSDKNTLFRLGGFNLPLNKNESARIIRSFNVLRQYKENEVKKSLHLLANSLMTGGIILEGTSDPYGRLWVANLIRKTKTTPLHLEALVFSTNFRWGFHPGLFQPVLPKNLIHKMVKGEAIHAFFSAWEEAANLTIAHKQFGQRQWFIAAAQALSDFDYSIDLRKKMLKKGFLIWQKPDLEI